MKVNKEKNHSLDEAAEVIIKMRTKQEFYPRMRIKMEAQSHRIDWGDGVEDKRITHYYKNEGTYEVCIRAKKITYLNVANCGLEELIVSGAKGLKILVCCFNQLTKLNMTALDEIEALDCSANKLEKLYVNDRLNLKRLECSNNELERLDVDGCKDLVFLYCNKNKLTDLSFEGCANLRSIRCDRNCFDAEKLDGMAANLPYVDVPEHAHIKISNNPGSDACKIVRMNHKGWNVNDENYF